ncbi:hypothetical protein [Ursidibacter sp. B-7004-1]
MMKLKKLSPIFGLIAFGLMALPAFATSSAEQIVWQTAESMGGVEKIKSLSSLKLQGYGQYEYMWGGGAISPSVEAPKKWIAANDLNRLWDFEQDTFIQKERINMLFPFAAKFGHDFSPSIKVLDGHNIAYDKLPDGKTIQVGYMSQNPLFIDGVRVRKLWSLTNPASLIHALLNKKARITHVQENTKSYQLTVQVDSKIELQVAIDKKSMLPENVQWYAPQNNLGEVLLTTSFTGYMPFDGIQLPMGYNTKVDFRDVVYLKIYVDGYYVNKPIDKLTTPKAFQNNQKINHDVAPTIAAEKIAQGVWRLTGGTMVVEFSDHLVLFELYGSQAMGKAIIEKANQLVVNKKATKLIVSHHHFDHTDGFRAAVAANLEIYSHQENEGILREIAERTTPHFDDVLEGKADFHFVPINKPLVLEDQTQRLEIYPVISNNHMANAVFAYLPKEKIFFDADIGTAADEWQLWPDSYLDNVEHYGLTVEKILSVHEKTMQHEALLKFIQEGYQRSRQREEKHRAINDFLPGYPIFRTR